MPARTHCHAIYEAIAQGPLATAAQPPASEQRSVLLTATRAASGRIAKAIYKDYFGVMRMHFATPLALPLYGFSGAILAGAILLWLPVSWNDTPVPFIDALFTSTSAVCVTGLATVDIASSFSRVGHVVIMALVQLGGLGIITYSSLFMFLWRKRISLTDRLSVGRALLHDPSFDLGRFLSIIVLVTLALETLGFLAILLSAPELPIFSALFLAVSSFCNAGFALMPDNLMAYRSNLGINLAVAGLITFGGIGFAVLEDLLWFIRCKVLGIKYRLALTSRVIISVSMLLTFGGAAGIFILEYLSGHDYGGFKANALAAFFQSVTCRTAGFNTVSIAHMGTASLLFMILLMFIGGSPGSCAGGIKTTTARVLASFVKNRFVPGRQITIGQRAASQGTLDNALTLLIFALLTLGAAVFILLISESRTAGSDVNHQLFLNVLFEATSAFGTVGLTMDFTSTLTTMGKCVISCLMFLSRVGPLWVLAALHQWQRDKSYSVPEVDLPIG